MYLFIFLNIYSHIFEIHSSIIRKTSQRLFLTCSSSINNSIFLFKILSLYFIFSHFSELYKEKKQNNLQHPCLSAFKTTYFLRNVLVASVFVEFILSFTVHLLYSWFSTITSSEENMNSFFYSSFSQKANSSNSLLNNFSLTFSCFSVKMLVIITNHIQLIAFLC